MNVVEMLEIIENCVPTDDGKFVNEETGEVFTDDDLTKLEGDFEHALDSIGMAVIESQARAEMKKQLAKKYAEESKRDEKRAERMQYFLGYLTGGKKKKCDHVTIAYYGKQERLAFRCKESEIPDEYKKDYVTRVADKVRIRAELEKENSPVLSFAYIDVRKKASVK